MAYSGTRFNVPVWLPKPFALVSFFILVLGRLGTATFVRVSSCSTASCFQNSKFVARRSRHTTPFQHAALHHRDDRCRSNQRRVTTLAALPESLDVSMTEMLGEPRSLSEMGDASTFQDASRALGNIISEINVDVVLPGTDIDVDSVVDIASTFNQGDYSSALLPGLLFLSAVALVVSTSEKSAVADDVTTTVSIGLDGSKEASEAPEPKNKPERETAWPQPVTAVTTEEPAVEGRKTSPKENIPVSPVTPPVPTPALGTESYILNFLLALFTMVRSAVSGSRGETVSEQSLPGEYPSFFSHSMETESLILKVWMVAQLSAAELAAAEKSATGLAAAEKDISIVMEPRAPRLPSSLNPVLTPSVVSE